MRKRLRILLVCLLAGLYSVLACGCGGKGSSGPLSMQVKEPDVGFVGTLTPQPTEPVPDVGGGEQGGATEDWIPDILDRDEPYVPSDFDDSMRYDYSAGKVRLVTANGSFSEQQGAGPHPDYTVTSAYSLAVSPAATPFPYGTFSCDVRTVAGADSGIVFGLTANGTQFWELGVSYYIFLLSADGKVYLGKIDDGSWSVLQSVSYSFNTVDAFTLKVVYRNGKICCFINGTLLIEAKERNPLTGTGFGIRGGGAGAVFSNLSLTSEYLI